VDSGAARFQASRLPAWQHAPSLGPLPPGTAQLPLGKEEDVGDGPVAQSSQGETENGISLHARASTHSNTLFSNPIKDAPALCLNLRLTSVCHRLPCAWERSASICRSESLPSTSALPALLAGALASIFPPQTSDETRELRQRSRYCHGASGGTFDNLELLPLYLDNKCCSSLSTAALTRSQYNNIGLCPDNTRCVFLFFSTVFKPHRHSLCGSHSPSPSWLLPARPLAWLRRTNTEMRMSDSQDICEQ